MPERPVGAGAASSRLQTGEPAQSSGSRYVLFDVDGTLMDAVSNQRQVWRAWASRYGLDADEVHQTALRTRPLETFAAVAGNRDPDECLAVLHELEDEDCGPVEGKPSPVPYLRADALLGAQPMDCLVIEDAPSGVESGLRAGMTVWAVNAATAIAGVHRSFGSLRSRGGIVIGRGIGYRDALAGCRA